MARLVVVLLALTGCLVNIDYGSGGYLCSDEAPECPDGLSCIDGVCTTEGAPDAGPPADAGPAPKIDKHLLGDVLTLDFNDPLGVGVFRDRSGGRHDAIPASATVRVAGVYGTGVDPSSSTPNRIPDFDELMFGADGVTIEAWVENRGATPAVIIGDLDTFPAPTSLEMGLYFNAVDELTFAVQEMCGGAVLVAQTNYPLPSLSHVAVTWDRSEVRFYKDGNQVGNAIPLVAAGCEQTRDYRIGEAVGRTGELDGLIDELKITAGVKTASEIAASMNFDSAASDSDCGNRVLDPAEQCDSDSVCCDVSTCEYAANSTPCGGSGTCGDGVCQVSPARSSTGALLVYDFASVAGGVVSDESGVAPALDLTITPVSAVVAKGETLSVIDETVEIVTAATTAKITDPIEQAGDFTLEVWVQPANDTQGAAQPTARILSMSPDQNSRNFTLGQTGDRYVARLMSSTSNPNGQPILHTRAGVVDTTVPTHIVVTRENNGARRLYINGELVDQSVLAGDLPWDPLLPIRLAHEAIALRPFLGTYHFVAVYEGAFSEQRVASHFLAGP